MALTKSQLKEVLDKVYNNGQSYETYENDNFNGIRLYINDVEGNSNTTILTRKEDDNTYIVAVFPIKSWVYTEGTEEKVYKCRVINDDMVVTNISNIYARGVGAYIKRLTYIKNICVFLGIKLSKNFDKENPVIYQDLSDICDKWFSTGKAPYYFGRYDRGGTPNYSTYVQYGVIKDICLYFNQLGVYRTSGSMDLCASQFLNNFSQNTANLSDFPTFEEFYKTVDKDKYYKRLKEIILFKIKDYSNITDKEECANSIVNILKIQYGDEINIDDILETSIVITNSSTYPFTLRLINIEKTCKACFSGMGEFRITRLYNDNNFSQTTFEIIKQSNGTINHNKSTTLKNANTIYYGGGSGYIILNLKNDKLLKLYNGESFRTAYGSIGYPVEYYSSLSLNTVYNIGSQIKLLDKRLLLCSYNINDSDSFASFYYYMKSNNINLDEKDLFIILRVRLNNVYRLIACIIKDVNTVKFTNSLNILRTSLTWLSQICYKTRSNNVETNYPILTNLYQGEISSLNINNDRISLDSSKDCYIYNMNTYELLGNMTLSQNFQYSNICSYIGATLDTSYGLINFGEFIDYIPPTSLNGLSVIEGSTLPNSVIDETSFNAFLNSINATTSLIRNPYYVSDELQDNVNVETWLQCTVYDTPPATQAEAVDNDIDDMPEAEVENLEDDIKDNTDNNDEDEDEDPDSEGEKDTGENEGNNTIPTINDVFKYNMSQFETQWLLSEAEFQALGLLINSSDFLQNISTLIASVLGIDPLSGIISVQVAPISLIPNVDLTLQTMCIRGIEMTGNVKFKDTGLKSVTVQGNPLKENVKEFDLGEELIDEKFGSYMDLIDTQMTLYLPFIGNIDLDIRDFYLGKLWIKGFVESFTGQIVYYIISKDKPDTKGNLQTKIVSTLTGNCYSTIPLTQDCYGSFMNSFTRG